MSSDRLLPDGQVLIGPSSIITMTSPLLGGNLGWKGKFLFVAKYGDIFLPVFLPYDKLRWSIDRPMSLVQRMQLYAAGDWLKTVRGEQGYIPAVNMITELQHRAMISYHNVIIANRGIESGERGISRLVSKGARLESWGEVVSPSGEQK